MKTENNLGLTQPESLLFRKEHFWLQEQSLCLRAHGIHLAKKLNKLINKLNQ